MHTIEKEIYPFTCCMIFLKEISMYGTRKCLNKGNLAAILFYAN